MKISNSLHRTWRLKTLSGLFSNTLFKVCLIYSSDAPIFGAKFKHALSGELDRPRFYEVKFEFSPHLRMDLVNYYPPGSNAVCILYRLRKKKGL